MNLLNEEIRSIQHTINHLKMAIPLEADSGKKLKLQNECKDLQKLLESKLNECGEYHG